MAKSLSHSKEDPGGIGPGEGYELRFPKSSYFKRELIEKALEFSPRSKQIVLCSFPKCDSKYLEIILWKLIHPNCDRIPCDDITNRCLTCMEMMGSNESSKSRSSRIVKTYLPLPVITYHKGAKYIYVVRNPWDACMSFFRLLRSDPANDYSDFNRFYKDFVKGRVGYGSFFTHVLEWEKIAEKENVLILFHENISHNLRSTAFTVAAFLGEEYLAQLTHDDGYLSDILKATGWDKRQLAKLPPSDESLLTSIMYESLGSVNELLWRKRFEVPSCSIDQLQTLAEIISEKMKNTNIQYLWHGLLQKLLLAEHLHATTACRFLEESNVY